MRAKIFVLAFGVIFFSVSNLFAQTYSNKKQGDGILTYSYGGDYRINEGSLGSDILYSFVVLGPGSDISDAYVTYGMTTNGNASSLSFSIRAGTDEGSGNLEILLYNFDVGGFETIQTYYNSNFTSDRAYSLNEFFSTNNPSKYLDSNGRLEVQFKSGDGWYIDWIEAQWTLPEPAISVTPGSNDFGERSVDDIPKSFTFRVDNTGDGDLNVSPSIAGTDASQFSIVDGNSFIVTPGNSGYVEVQYDPSVAGSHSAVLRLNHNASNTSDPLDVSLSGSATAPEPAISVTPGSNDFGERSVDDIPKSFTFRVDNTGDGDLNVSPSIAGTDASQFSIVDGNSFIVTPGNSGYVEVQYDPSVAGSHSAVLRLNHNASNTSDPLDVSLSGSATDDPVVDPTSKAILVTVDGLDPDATFDGTFGSDLVASKFSNYLAEGIGNMSFGSDISINPFSWNRDATITDQHVSELQKFISDLYTISQNEGKKFIIVSHSWGTFLTYAALAKEKQAGNTINPDLLITLSSPLGTKFAGVNYWPSYNARYTESLVIGYVEYWLEKLALSNCSSCTPQINSFVNYWAWGDIISGPLNEKISNVKDIKVDGYNERSASTTLLKWHDYTSLRNNNEVYEGVRNEIMSILNDITEPPKPNINFISDIPDTIKYKQAINLRVSAENIGGEASYGSITTSMPKFIEGDDGQQINVLSSTTNSTNIDLYPIGDSRLNNRAGTSFSSKYLTVEYGNSPWYKGEKHEMAISITPEETGVFVINTRANMGNTETGSYYNIPMESGVYDHQGWPVISDTVFVEAPPQPEILAFPELPQEIVLGKSFDIDVSATNSGGNASYGAINVSFPGASDPNALPAIETFADYTSDEPGYQRILPGDQIGHQDGSKVSASYLAYEYGDNNWRSDENNTTKIRVTPQKEGTFTFYMRVNQGNVETNDWYNVPTTSSTTDQQGWPVRKYQIEVVKKSTISVTAPPTGAVWGMGTEQLIEWSSQNLSGTVDIALLNSGGKVTDIATGTSNDGSQPWTIGSGLTAGTDYRVAITASSDPAVGDTSGTFEITSERTPVISLSASQLSFGEVVIGSDSTRQYTVSGSNLSGAVSVSAPSGFTIATSSAGTFTSSLTISQADVEAGQQLYVRFSPTADKNYSGSITHSSSGATDKSISIEGTGVSTPPPPSSIITAEYTSGWNLISIPEETSGQQLSDYFSQSITTDVFEFAGNYKTVTNSVNGKAYWVKLGSEETVEFDGTLIQSLTLNLEKGWNLVGTTSDTLDVSTDIQDSGGIIENGQIWKVSFNSTTGKYEVVETSQMLPGKGYFIKATASGTVTLSKQ